MRFFVALGVFLVLQPAQAQIPDLTQYGTPSSACFPAPFYEQKKS
jgi:hypothetical protein